MALKDDLWLWDKNIISKSNGSENSKKSKIFLGLVGKLIKTKSGIWWLMLSIASSISTDWLTMFNWGEYSVINFLKWFSYLGSLSIIMVLNIKQFTILRMNHFKKISTKKTLCCYLTVSRLILKQMSRSTLRIMMLWKMGIYMKSVFI